MTHVLRAHFDPSATSRAQRSLVSFLALALATFAVSPRAALAQEAPESPARTLFNEGRKLVSEGDYAAACPKFETSLRLEVGVGTQFNLADCWEHIGRTASAHALFLGAAASARAAGQAEREQVLRDRATALEPRLSRLVIEVASTDPKLTVKRDDLPIESDNWGKALLLDPGKYEISARAPGKQVWQQVVEVAADKPVTTVRVPVLEAEKPPAAAPEPVKATPAPVRAIVAVGRPSENGDDRQPTYVNYPALAVAGVGLGAIVVGGVMGSKYSRANDSAKGICPSRHDCTNAQIQEHQRLVDEAKTDRAWSYAGFGVGGAALLGAGALWFLQKPKPGATATFQAAPVLAADGSVGALLSGSF